MSDDRQDAPAGQPDDGTHPLPPADGQQPPDRTQQLPGPMDRATPDHTAPLRPPGPAAWSGRAEVPPRPADYREAAGTEWYAEEQAGRRWWLPILWGVILLLLLGVLGVGLWLALQVAEDGGPDQVPSPSPSSTAAAPTSANPTTQSPSPPPTTTAAARVRVPPLVNLPEEAAKEILDALGLDHRVEYRPSDRPAGTVIATDPEAGELVDAGEEVTLVVSAEGPGATTSAATPTAEPTPTG